MIRKQVDIDEETGEIHNQKAYKYTIFDDVKGYLFRAKNYGSKMFTDIKLSSEVPDIRDYARCHLLAENIYKDTNMISYRVSARKIRPADVEDISKLIKLEYRRTKDFLSRMRKAHVIAERVDSVGDLVSTKYYFNPLFFSSNKYLNPDLYFLFQESLDCYLPEWVKQRFHETTNIKEFKTEINKDGEG